MKKVLFICIHNSGRSQMAEAFFNEMAKGKAYVFSAGTIPSNRINQGVVTAMLELGINLEGKKSKKLSRAMLNKADRVITMGCGMDEACPTSFTITENWNLTDPEGKSLDEIREIRDEIRLRVKQLITKSLYSHRIHSYCVS